MSHYSAASSPNSYRPQSLFDDEEETAPVSNSNGRIGLNVNGVQFASTARIAAPTTPVSTRMMPKHPTFYEDMHRTMSTATSSREAAQRELDQILAEENCESTGIRSMKYSNASAAAANAALSPKQFQPHQYSQHMQQQSHQQQQQQQLQQQQIFSQHQQFPVRSMPGSALSSSRVPRASPIAESAPISVRFANMPSDSPKDYYGGKSNVQSSPTSTVQTRLQSPNFTTVDPLELLEERRTMNGHNSTATDSVDDDDEIPYGSSQTQPSSNRSFLPSPSPTRAQTSRRPFQQQPAPLSPALVLSDQFKIAPSSDRVFHMLKSLTDSDYRKVMEKWMRDQEQETLMASPTYRMNSQAAPIVSSVPATSPIHVSILSSYLSVHPWGFGPPLMLKYLFGFLPLIDLVVGARGTCRLWNEVLAARAKDGTRQSWTKKQVLVVQQKINNSDLLTMLSSIPAARSIAIHGPQPAVVLTNALRHIATLLPNLYSLEITHCTNLQSGDLKALQPSLFASPFANQSPAGCAIQAITLKQCVAVDIKLMECLSQLPHLSSLSLDSLQPLTASKQVGLHLLCASSMNATTSTPTAAFPLLTSLSLSPLSSDACLTHILPCTQLKSLELHGSISDIGIQSLCVLTKLHKLHIHCSYQFSSSMMASRLGSRSTPVTMTLDELSGLCDGSGLSGLDGLEELTQLSVVIPGLSLAGIEAICTLPHIQHLSIGTHDKDNTNFGSPTMISLLANIPALLSLFHMVAGLRSLDLSGCPWLNDEQLSFLMHPLTSQRLKELNLNSLIGLTDITAYWITKLAGLRWLNITGTSLTARKGVKEIMAKNRDVIIIFQQSPVIEKTITPPMISQTERAATKPAEPHKSTTAAASAAVSTSVETQRQSRAPPRIEHDTKSTAAPAMVVKPTRSEMAIQTEVVSEASSKSISSSSRPGVGLSLADLDASRSNVIHPSTSTDSLSAKPTTRTFAIQTDDEVEAIYQARLELARQEAETKVIAREMEKADYMIRTLVKRNQERAATSRGRQQSTQQQLQQEQPASIPPPSQSTVEPKVPSHASSNEPYQSLANQPPLTTADLEKTTLRSPIQQQKSPKAATSASAVSSSSQTELIASLSAQLLQAHAMHQQHQPSNQTQPQSTTPVATQLISPKSRALNLTVVTAPIVNNNNVANKKRSPPSVFSFEQYQPQAQTLPPTQPPVQTQSQTDRPHKRNSSVQLSYEGQIEFATRHLPDGSLTAPRPTQPSPLHRGDAGFDWSPKLAPSSQMTPPLRSRAKYSPQLSSGLPMSPMSPSYSNFIKAKETLLGSGMYNNGAQPKRANGTNRIKPPSAASPSSSPNRDEKQEDSSARTESSTSSSPPTDSTRTAHSFPSRSLLTDVEPVTVSSPTSQFRQFQLNSPKSSPINHPSIIPGPTTDLNTSSTSTDTNTSFDAPVNTFSPSASASASTLSVNTDEPVVSLHRPSKKRQSKTPKSARATGGPHVF